MIRLEDVTRKYGDTTAVDHLSLEIRDGEVCVFIGPSGCGKTTTLRMINRLVEPSSGRIFIDEKDTSHFNAEKLRLNMGYAIQSVGLFPHLTVAQNVAIVPQLLGWDPRRTSRRVEELLALVGLKPAEYASKYPHQLSGGEAQRAGVARALAADPPILLMDEPFGAVDPLTRERLQSQFLHIQRELKKTVALVTHDLDEAIRLADRIVVMQSGRLVQFDTPEAILAKPVNRFVRDFVGTDRALKRLSRMEIGPFVRPTTSLNVGLSTHDALSGREANRPIWVVDEGGRLLGWADHADLLHSVSLREATNFSDDEISLRHGATLREALSRMLGLGFKFVPVVDDGGKLIGELALSDVERATEDV